MNGAKNARTPKKIIAIWYQKNSKPERESSQDPRRQSAAELSFSTLLMVDMVRQSNPRSCNHSGIVMLSGPPEYDTRSF